MTASLCKNVTSPTRGIHILDLFFTSNPTLIDSVSILPGLSGHVLVQVLVNTYRATLNRSHVTSTFTKKADWDQYKQTMRDFQSELLTDLATTVVQEPWDKFASRLDPISPPSPSIFILTVPRRYFCCGSLLLLVLAVRIYTLVQLLC